MPVQNSMPRPTLLLQTLGCSKNTVDSEHILAALSSSYDIVQSAPADVFLINTCSFIADAKQESIDAILEAVALKDEGKYGKVVVMGCLGQRYSKEMPGLIPEVDAWFGARDFAPLLDYLGSSAQFTQENRLSSGPSHYAYLKISEGCNRHCSYCAIPMIRGRHRSVPMEKLVGEARLLAANGVKELLVIAQDITYYGLDLYGKRSLAQLLRELSRIEGIEWIRLHYSFPTSFPEDVLDEMASNPKICKYMDIPLQHSSTKLLKMMRRGIDEKGTRALVEKMRKVVPGVALRTTLIVGHPGETEEEFENLLEFVRWARFEKLGAFTYSEEENTYSAKHYPDDIPQEVKQRRLDTLMTLQEEISSEINREKVGKTMRVIVDAFSDGVLVCRSEADSPDVDGEVLVKYEPASNLACPEELVGSFINVRITGADSYDLIGVMLGQVCC